MGYIIYISFSSFAVDEQGAFVFSWFGSEKNKSNEFIESFNKIDVTKKPDALLQFLFIACENIFINPKWWEKLPLNIQNWLIEIASNTHSPFHPLITTYYLNEYLNISDFFIKDIKTNAL
ncbi:MAG: hypothetical protein ACOX5R_20500 [bacterium]